MKKFISLIAIAAMALVMTAGSALAAFEDSHLVRVIYSTVGSEEIATDLGLVSDVLASTDGTAFAQGSFALNDFAGASWADLNVAYLAVDTYAYSGWLSGPVERDSLPITGNYNDMLSFQMLTASYYKTLPLVGGNTVVADQGAPNSYNTLMNGGSPGYLASFLTEPIAETSLADLATIGQVDQGLFYSPGLWEAANSQIAVLRTMADGSTMINPAAAPVPVPASVLLFGTGLVGLIGLRRKSA